MEWGLFRAMWHNVLSCINYLQMYIIEMYTAEKDILKEQVYMVLKIVIWISYFCSNCYFTYNVSLFCLWKFSWGHWKLSGEQCRNPIFDVHCLHVFSFFMAKILTDFVHFFTFMDMSRIFNFYSLLESSPNHSLRFPGVQPFYISGI